MVHALLTVALLRDAEGRPQRIVGVVEDITEHLRLAEAERARETAESSNRAKSEFLSRMSHELRTPLNAMLGFAQLLSLDRKPVLAEHQRAWAAQIQQAGWHLLEMINDTLDLSRIESGMLRLEPVTLELEPLVQRRWRMVEPAAAKRGLHIEHRLERRAPCRDGRRDARQADPDQPAEQCRQVQRRRRQHRGARAADRAQVVEIAVSDTGLGMTRAQMAELFQPYNRLGRERSARRRHRHRPGHQPAAGRADGRLAARAAASPARARPSS